jgi:hypothetical protein
MCPYCGHEDLEFDTNYVFDGNHHFRYECPEFGGLIDTVDDETDFSGPHEMWTLQFVPEFETEPPAEDNDVIGMEAIKIIETDAEFAVKAERAGFNMHFGACEEVQAEDYAIRHLYQFLSRFSDIEADEEEFEAGRWLAEMSE